MYHSHSKVEEHEVALYHPTKKIRCIVKTSYGSHNKNSNYNYAYKIETTPIKS